MEYEIKPLTREEVIFLSTNETITVKGSGEPYEAEGMPSLCEEFTDPENVRGMHVYEKVGFRSEHRMLDDEELFKIVFN